MTPHPTGWPACCATAGSTSSSTREAAPSTGPKVDVLVTDALGREWQGGTFQLDFLMPERFGLEYVGADNHRHQAVVIHRTLLGSMERFIGGLIEHYGGAFPLWLAPEQVRILPVSEQWTGSAAELAGALGAAGLRVELDDRDTLGYRIRAAEMQKIPYMGIVGQREAEAGTVSVRMRGAGRKQVTMDRADFARRLKDEAAARALEPIAALDTRPASLTLDPRIVDNKSLCPLAGIFGSAKRKIRKKRTDRLSPS